MSNRRQAQKGEQSTPRAQRRGQVSGHDRARLATRAHPAALLRRAGLNPGSLAPDEVLQLQRAFGNRAVNRLLRAGRVPVVQAKLVVTPAADGYEQEADRIADRVVQDSAPPARPAVRRGGGDEGQIQRKSPVEPITSLKGSIREKYGSPGGGTPGAAVERRIGQARGGGRPLAGEVRGPLEDAFGLDFSGVRIHADAESDALNRTLDARAFTTGRDIFFRQGEYDPGSPRGRRLLAHELTHVVQQNGAAALRHQGGKDDPAPPGRVAGKGPTESLRTRTEAGNLIQGSADTFVQLTRAGDTLKAYFLSLQEELLSLGKGSSNAYAIESPQGLKDLVAEINTIIETGLAGWSDIAGKIRELMLGYQRAKQGERVQFGLKESVGGDVVIWRPGQKGSETVQSKYVTGAQLDALANNIMKAVYQLSGASGEVPYKRTERVADIVIEDDVYAARVLASPAALAKIVRQALDDEEHVYPQIDLWTQVERIRVTSSTHKATVKVNGKDKPLTGKIEKTTGAPKVEDFPGLADVATPEALKSIKTLFGEHTTELIEQRRVGTVVPPPTPRATVAPPRERAESLVNRNDPPKKDVEEYGLGLGQLGEPKKKLSSEQAGKLTQILKDFKDKVETTVTVPDIMGIIESSPLVESTAPDLELLRQALTGAHGPQLQTETWKSLLPGILGQIQAGGKSLDLGTRLSKLKGKVKQSGKQKELKIEATATDERLAAVEGYPPLLNQLSHVPKELRWEPAVVIAVFKKLQSLGGLAANVAAEAAADLLQAPYSLEVSKLIAAGTLEDARARNYAVVLGQLKNREERGTAVGPLKYAGDMWKANKAFAKQNGLILAFEYDEKTPGMWQYTRQHFDMDVGWVYERQHLSVHSLWQVKVVANDQSAILNAMHASLEKGQLSLDAPGGKRLVIFCPSGTATTITADSTWKTKLVRRLPNVDLSNTYLELIFRDGKLVFDLEAIKKKAKEESFGSGFKSGFLIGQTLS